MRPEPSNALPPMLVTVSGREMLLREEQFLKVLHAMDVAFSGQLMLSNA